MNLIPGDIKKDFEEYTKISQDISNLYKTKNNMAQYDEEGNLLNADYIEIITSNIQKLYDQLKPIEERLEIFLLFKQIEAQEQKSKNEDKKAQIEKLKKELVEGEKKYRDITTPIAQLLGSKGFKSEKIRVLGQKSTRLVVDKSELLNELWSMGRDDLIRTRTIQDPNIAEIKKALLNDEIELANAHLQENRIYKFKERGD